MKKITVFVVLAACLILTQCSHEGTGISRPSSRIDINRPLSKGEISLIEADNKFAFDIFREINRTDADSNMFISPFSISMALGMTLNGAEGTTKTAMEEVLGLYGMTSQEINESYKSLNEFLTLMDWSVVLNTANSIWYREDLQVHQEFIDINRNYFAAEVAKLNFLDSGATNIINDWVKSKTNGLIPKILDNIPGYMVMYLINTIYFKGEWQSRFDPSDTRDWDFHLEDGSTKTVKMMQMTSSARLYNGDSYAALELPYGEGHYSMTILLPQGELTVGSLADRLTQDEWTTIKSSMSESDELLIKIPRFKMKYKKSLKDILTSLGMGIAFTASADFTGIADGGLFIDDVNHSTFVEVNEEGTEAAAATVVGIRVVSAPAGFTADRPFLFVISEAKTGAILFMGKMLDPDSQ